MEDGLTAIALGLSEIESLDELLPFVLLKATEMFSADRAMFAVCDPQGRIRRATRHNMEVREDGRLPVSDGLVNAVLTERRTVVIEDTAKSLFNSRESVKLNNIRFMLGVPVMGGKRLLGILYIDSTSQKYLGPPINEQRRLEGLAGVVSLTLRHIESAEEKNYRERFLEAVMHNVRNSLQVMRATIEGLAHEPQSEDSQDLIDTLKGSVTSLDAVSSSVLELNKLEDAKSSPTVWIDPVIEIRQRTRFIALFARTVTQKDVVLDTRPTPMVYTDAARFGMVVDELLLNAIKYSGDDRAVSVTVHSIETPKQRPLSGPTDVAGAMHRLPRLQPTSGTSFIRFTFTNANRAGRIAPDVLEKIFEPYTRAETQWSRYSTGLGLSVIRALVTSLGGAIFAESNDDTTSFSVDLPCQVDAPPE